MAKILINDGMHPSGIQLLKDAGHEVNTNKIEQEELSTSLPEYDAICVRSATKVREDLIAVCPNLKVIGRGGVGLDNIDVTYARSNNIHVINTPAASSRSVAELAFAHMLSVARFLYKSNRNMPADGDTEFKSLKKSFAKGFELEGKTLGIIGAGRIGRETAKIALGIGMNVQFHDPFVASTEVAMTIAGNEMTIPFQTVTMDQLLAESDILSLHIPFTGTPVLAKDEFDKMKKGIVIINAARGGTINEDALLEAIDSGIVAAAGLDVFENEPTPRKDLLQHPRISLTPHIGASTNEAQEKIGIELAEQLIDLLS